MAGLAAEAFNSDPRVRQAKKLLLEALAEHQRALTGIKPPDPASRDAYSKLIEQFGAVRAGALYYPYLGTGMGRGLLVELADGSVKYDMINGIGVHYMGHGH